MSDETEQPRVMVHMMPKREPCDHQWPSTMPKDEDACVKCGIPFLTYVFMECP